MQAQDGFLAQIQPFSKPKRVPESSHGLALAAAREMSLTEAPLQLSLPQLPPPTQVPCSLSVCPPGSPHKARRAKAARSPRHTRPPTREALPALLSLAQVPPHPPQPHCP